MFTCNPLFTHLKTIALSRIRIGFKKLSFEYLPFSSNKNVELRGERGEGGIHIYMGIYPFVCEVKFQ
jgi:hypothetical protein